jgi:hypothetical protein
MPLLIWMGPPGRPLERPDEPALLMILALDRESGLDRDMDQLGIASAEQ